MSRLESVTNENFAIYETKLGHFKVKYIGDEITFLKRIESEDVENFGVKTELTDKLYSQLCEYLDGKRECFDLPLKLVGTEFQKKVWQALCDIPYGETRSYKDVAIAVGNPKASRAVGMANNKNPINVIVPCHRVIGASGKLVGYAGGLSMKEFLLDVEKGK